MLCRGRRLDDLRVVFGGQREPALQPRARVLGAAALETVRQQDDEAGEPLPLVLRAHDELVDDDLRDVGEVAVLRLPQHEPLGAIQAVAPLEAEHPGLAERAVVDLDGLLVRRQMRERRVRLAVLVVVEDRVALTERTARDVLAGEADVHATGDQ